MPSGKSQQQQEATIKSILTKAGYRNLELTKRDVLGALNQYPSLKPYMEKFTFNDGRQRDLLVLNGTIPVSYRGNTYNIPVAVWVTETHPNHCPICFVKPTADMMIKVGHDHVDANGKVYMPYLNEWSAHSDILTLIQMMIIVFSEQPPVFARTQQQQQQQRPPQPQPYPVGPAYGGYPARPASYPAMPYPPAGAVGQGMPPYPAAQPSHGTPYPPGAGGGGGAQQPPYPPMGAVPYGGGGGGYPPPYTTVQTQQQSSNGPGDSGTITQEMLKMSLMSAVEDKIKKELADDFNTKQAEIHNLKKMEEDLNSGRLQLQATLQRLDAESTELDSLCKAMSGEATSLESALDRLESLENNEGEETIDDKIVTVTPLFKQVVTCYSEDLALQDAIYYLSEGLRKGVLDCDSFLKKVRELSRKQFYVRATLQKAREKAGLTV